MFIIGPLVASASVLVLAHPLQAAGLGAGCAFFVSWLITRPRSRA